MILVNDVDDTPFVYKSISVTFKDRLVFAEVKKDQKKLLTGIDAGNLPALIVIPRGKDESPIFYDGAMKTGALKLFLDEFALPKQSKRGKKVKGDSKDHSEL